MQDCIFCKIAKGEIPSTKVYEDDLCVAFHDLNPMAKVHVLIIPKEHITSVAQINEENSYIIAHIFKTIPQVANLLNLDGGYRVATNCGEHACQSVQHLHFHILGGQQLRSEMC